MKSVRILSFSGPCLVQMRENTNQKNSEYGNFLRSAPSQCKTEVNTFFIRHIFFPSIKMTIADSNQRLLSKPSQTPKM